MTNSDLAEVLERLRVLGVDRTFAGKRVVCTGARGFLGQAFTRTFSALGAEVVAIDRYALAQEMGAAPPAELPGVENVDHDVTKPFPLWGRVDYVLPLAAIASPVHYAKHSLVCHDVIVQGTRNMLELAGAKGATMLLPSTSELYGDSGWGGSAMREESLGSLDPWDVRGRAYDVPKLCAEALASIFDTAGVKIQTVRYFNVFGPPMSRHDYRVMSRFAAAVVDGQPLQVHGFGDYPTRSFCYITDAIVGSFLVLANGDGRPYNVGNPDEHSMRRLASLFAEVGEEIAGRALTVEHVEPPAAYVKQPRRRRPDITRLLGLGFEPRVGLRVGIGRLLSWAVEAYK